MKKYTFHSGKRKKGTYLGNICLTILFIFGYAGSAFAQNAALEFSNTGGPAGNGPTTASQVVTLQNNTDNPIGSTFVAYTPTKTVTFSLTNHQRTSVAAPGVGLMFGGNAAAGSSSAGSLALYHALGSVGSATATNFRSYGGLGTVGSEGISATANYGIQLYNTTRPFYEANSPLPTATTPVRYYVADLVITFNTPVNNPIVHFGGLGATTGNFSNNTLMTISSEMQLMTSGLTLTRLSGSTEFSVPNTTEILNSAVNYTATTGSGAASGSVRVNGSNITSITFRVYMKAKRGTAATTSWTGSAPQDENYNAGDGFTVSVSAGESDLSVIKTVNNANPSVGQNVVFTVTATNNGPSTNTNVVVQDVLPTGYTLVSAVPSTGSWSAPNWTIPSLANGASATLTVTATVRGTGNHTNTATISGDLFDPVSSNNTATVTPSVACVISASNPDSDGDGIADSCDLDDDNDGILDVVECPTNLITNGTFTTNLSGWTAGTGWVYNSGNGGTVINDNNALSVGSLLSQSITNLNTVSNGIVALNLKLGAKDFNNLAGNTATLEVILNGVTYAIFTNGTSRSTSNITLALSNGASSNFSAFGTSSVPTDFSQSTPFTLFIPYTGPSTATLSFRMVSTADDWQLDDISIYPLNCDTDGDGIRNHLDLDSDGDNCPDVIEGGANFQTGASYIIGDKLNTAVNASGVPAVPVATPTITGYTQTAGQTIGQVNISNPVVAGTASADQTISSGSAPVALTLAGSSGTIQWQVSTDNVTFTNVASGGTTVNYSPGALTATRYYRVLLTSAGGCTALSNVVTITICNAGTATPTINPAVNYTALNSSYNIPCGATTANLSGLTASNKPGSATLTWHSGTPATNANKIANVTALTGTTKYYTAFFDSVNNCYSPTTEVVVYVAICANNDDYTAIPITYGVEKTLPSVFTNDTYNGTIISTMPPASVGFDYSIWVPANANINFSTGVITVPPTVLPGTYTYSYKIVDKDTDGVYDSNASYASVTFRVIADSDGDGIHDEADMDDDNDGILDTAEGFCATQTVYTMDMNATLVSANASFNANGGTFNLVYTLTSGTAVAGIGATFNVPFSYSDFTNTSSTVDHRWEGFNTSGTGLHIRPVTSQLYTGLPANNLTTETYNTAQSPDWNFKNWLNTGALNKLGTFTTTIGTIPTTSNLLSSYSSQTPLILYSDWNLEAAASATGGYYGGMQIQTTPEPGDYTSTADYSASYGQSYIWDYTAFNSNPASNSPTNGGNRGLITVIRNSITFCNHRDTDGDLTPDYLDLDSDGDGCADAIEGDENVTTAQLRVFDDINIVANGGIGSTPNVNLGVPNLVNSGGAADIGADVGQGIGYSRDILFNVCCINFPTAGTPDGYTQTGISNLAGFGTTGNGWPQNIPNGFVAIESKNQGFVITRVANTAAIATPVEGMLIYDISANCVKLYNGTSWKCLAKDCN